MTEVQSPQPAAVEPVTAALIAEHVKNKEIELWVKSRLLAGSLLGLAVGLLAHHYKFEDFGSYSHFIVGGVAFVAGLVIGDRAVFAVLGGLVVFLFKQ